MDPTISTHLESFATTLGPERDAVLTEMETLASERSFPIVGDAVGGWLAVLARMVDAQSVFEFGSGFGYSAYWFSRELPDDGRLVLTDLDGENLQQAATFLDRSPYEGATSFERGDAIETIESYDGPFDVVLIDNEKDRYAEAFEAVREKVAPGGIVLADNMIDAGSIEFQSLTELLSGASVETTDSTRGIAEYIDTVRADPAFETALLPLGEGLAVSHRR